MAAGSKPKAKGVIFYDANGGKHKAFLKKDSCSEIISSAGAIGSTQLLLLSGIGPSNSLQELGIKVVLNQPMVGKDMADNPSNGIVIPSPLPIELALGKIVGITKFGSYVLSLSGFNYSALSVSGAQTNQDSQSRLISNQVFIYYILFHNYLLHTFIYELHVFFFN